MRICIYFIFARLIFATPAHQRNYFNVENFPTYGMAAEYTNKLDEFSHHTLIQEVFPLRAMAKVTAGFRCAPVTPIAT